VTTLAWDQVNPINRDYIISEELHDKMIYQGESFKYLIIDMGA
jgi:hypothetical protein